jgi:hypothetical protein
VRKSAGKEILLSDKFFMFELLKFIKQKEKKTSLFILLNVRYRKKEEEGFFEQNLP